jgi:hypothetical protein
VRTALTLGALAGLALASYGLLAGPASREGAVPVDAVALVNGEPIPREAYARLVARVESERGRPLEPEERRRLLDRLVEETLLVQRGLALGLARHDVGVRRSLSSAVLQSITAETSSLELEPSRVEAFYAENRDYFAEPGRMRARHLRVPIADGDEPGARGRAERAAIRLRGGDPFESVEAELGVRPIAPLPDAPLPAHKIGDYLGSTLLARLARMEPHEVSEPVRVGDAFHVLALLERQNDAAPPLSEIEPEVRAEMRRRAGDEALRAYLDDLRAESEVRIAEDAR